MVGPEARTGGAARARRGRHAQLRPHLPAPAATSHWRSRAREPWKLADKGQVPDVQRRETARYASEDVTQGWSKCVRKQQRESHCSEIRPSQDGAGAATGPWSQSRWVAPSAVHTRWERSRAVSGLIVMLSLSPLPAGPACWDAGSS